MRMTLADHRTKAPLLRMSPRPTHAHRLTLTIAVTACLSALGLLAGAPAHAALTHAPLPEVSEKIAEGLNVEPQAMAVDSGHLWVAGGAAQLDEFDAATGALIAQLPPLAGFEGFNQGIAVGHEAGAAQLYVGSVDRVAEPGGAEEPEGRVAVFDEAGNLENLWTGADTPHGSFGFRGVAGVAVDDSSSLSDWAAGDVYVYATHGPLGGSASTEAAVDVFKPTAGGGEEFVTELPEAEPGVPLVPAGRGNGVAVDPATGDVLVRGSETAVDVFEPVTGMPGQYAFLFKITETPSAPLERVDGVTVDGASGEIYVSEGELGVLDQFSPSGAYLGQLTGLGPISGFAIDAQAPGDLYVSTGAVDVFGPDIVIPDVTTEPASDVGTKGATLIGTVNPDGAGKASCEFEWGTSPAFGKTVSCSAEVEGNAPVEVSAEITGLQPDTTYYYRLRASNSFGTNPGTASQDEQFTTLGAGVRGESVSSVTSESVTLEAMVDPHGRPTTAYFQYGTTDSYGAQAPVPPGASLGAGEGAVRTSTHLQALLAFTTYHYRVVALSEASPGRFEEFDAADQTFTTQRAGEALELPDGREWEMVTPPQKQGALFLPLDAEGEYDDGIIQASVAGGAIADLASQPSEPEPPGYSNTVSVLSTRGSTGWSSQVITPPHAEGAGPSVAEGSEYVAFSEDLSLAVARPFGNFNPLSPQATESTPYLRTDYLNGNVSEHCEEPVTSTSSCYLPLVTRSNDAAEPFEPFGAEQTRANGECELFCGPQFVDATPDLSHVFIRSSVALTSPPSEGGLYEWSAGRLRPADVLREEGGTVQYGTIDGFSGDGSHIVLTANQHIYLRDQATGEALQLDLPQGGPATGAAAPRFRRISADGSRVLFEDTEQLTATPGGGVYQCEIVLAPGLTCQLTLLPNSAGGLQGVPEQGSPASEDSAYVYVQGTGAVYADRFSAGAWTAIRTPMASLPAAVVVEATRAAEGVFANTVSANGQWVAFDSTADLTGYDSRNGINHQPDEEVYLYDAASNKLVCASCNPTGARPAGAESSWLPRMATTYSDGETPRKPRFLTDTGKLFFDSSEALVPQDVDGTEDVYQYEAAGVGSCTEASSTYGPRSGGCVSLISAGASPERSSFLDMSATGGDVFFLTVAKLTTQDFDDSADVYDAHECTAKGPCYPPARVAPPPCSTGDSCRAAPSPQPPLFGAPASATFSGEGNVVPSPPRPVAKKTAAQLRSQKLARALRLCKRDKRRRKRVACEKAAHKRYGAKPKPRKRSKGRK
jgi:hypothetical protein